jgi:hypothetical protein
MGIKKRTYRPSFKYSSKKRLQQINALNRRRRSPKKAHPSTATDEQLELELFPKTAEPK